MQRRLAVLSAAAGLAFASLLVRCFWVQIVSAQRWVRIAQKQHRPGDLARPRGRILDRNGETLALSLPAKAVYADPKLVENPGEAARLLGRVLLRDPKEIQKDLKQDRRFVWLARGLDLERAEALSRLKIKGIFLEDDLRRHYPFGDLARPLLGACDVDGRGISGLEYAYDAHLSGPAEASLRDGKGRRLPTAVSPGDLQLTLDARVQAASEETLRIHRQKTGARLAVAIVQDPATGEILAMASDPPDPLRNPAVQDAFEPGSIFKAVTAAAALEEGLVREEEVFHCENGSWKYLDVKISDPKPMGRLAFRDVLAESSNIGFAKLGLRLGSDRLWRYARAFGLGSPTGLEAPGESRGILRPPAKWSGASPLMVAFGQEISVTPIQMVSAFSVLANGGTWMQPWCVARLLRDGEILQAGRPRPLRRVVRPQTDRRLKDLLRAVVEKGTGRSAAIDGYPVAGKTGTAQKFDRKLGRYSREKHTASFCGFLPAGPSDTARLTILVLLDEPEGDYWAASVAAPVFRSIAVAAAGILDIPPPASLMRAN